MSVDRLLRHLIESSVDRTTSVSVFMAGTVIGLQDPARWASFMVLTVLRLQESARWASPRKVNSTMARSHSHLSSLHFQAKSHKTDASLNSSADVCGKVICLDYFCRKKKSILCKGYESRVNDPETWPKLMESFQSKQLVGLAMFGSLISHQPITKWMTPQWKKNPFWVWRR